MDDGAARGGIETAAFGTGSRGAGSTPGGGGGGWGDTLVCEDGARGFVSAGRRRSAIDASGPRRAGVTDAGALPVPFNGVFNWDKEASNRSLLRTVLKGNNWFNYLKALKNSSLTIKRLSEGL
jgi:hypothetical protein